jgi:hypothetical protein
MASEPDVLMFGKFVKVEGDEVHLELIGDYYYGAGEFYLIRQCERLIPDVPKLQVRMSRELFLAGVMIFKLANPDEALPPSSSYTYYTVIQKELFEKLTAVAPEGEST